MTRTFSASAVLLAGAFLFPARSLYGRDLPTRPSLVGLRAIGQIIATVSSGSREDANALQQLIEKRLDAAGIAIDPSLDTRLVANVDVARDTAPDGQRHFSYVISLRLMEPVVTERVPPTTFSGTTWSGNAGVTRFGSDIPFETVLDAVENKMNKFLAAVATDSEASGRRHVGRPSAE